MPANPDNSDVFLALTPPSASTGNKDARAIIRARAGVKTSAPGWLRVAKTGDSNAASA